MAVVKKSANQMWKESGTTLIFKDWLAREKQKGFLNMDGASSIPVNTGLNSSIQSAITELHQAGGEQTGLTNTYILGVNKMVWISLGVTVVLVTAGVIIYHKMKK